MLIIIKTWRNDIDNINDIEFEDFGAAMHFGEIMADNEKYEPGFNALFKNEDANETTEYVERIMYKTTKKNRIFEQLVIEDIGL